MFFCTFFEINSRTNDYLRNLSLKVSSLFFVFYVLLVLLIENAVTSADPLIYSGLSQATISLPPSPSSIGMMMYDEFIVRSSNFTSIHIGLANTSNNSSYPIKMENLKIRIENCIVKDQIILGDQLYLTDSSIEIVNNTIYGKIYKNNQFDGWSAYSNRVDSWLLRSVINISHNRILGFFGNNDNSELSSSSSSETNQQWLAYFFSSSSSSTFQTLPPFFEKECGIDFRVALVAKQDSIFEISNNIIVGGFVAVPLGKFYGNIAGTGAEYLSEGATFGILVAQIFLTSAMQNSNGKILIRNNNITLNLAGVTNATTFIEKMSGVIVVASGDSSVKKTNFGLNGGDDAGFFVENNFAGIMARSNESFGANRGSGSTASNVLGALVTVNGYFSNVNNLVVDGTTIHTYEYLPHPSQTYFDQSTIRSLVASRIVFHYDFISEMNTLGLVTFSNFKLFSTSYNRGTTTKKFQQLVDDYLVPFGSTPVFCQGYSLGSFYTETIRNRPNVMQPVVTNVGHLRLDGNILVDPLPVNDDFQCASLEELVLFEVALVSFLDNAAVCKITSQCSAVEISLPASGRIERFIISNNSLMSYGDKLLPVPVWLNGDRRIGDIRAPSRVAVGTSDVIQVLSGDETVINQLLRTFVLSVWGGQLRHGLNQVAVLNISDNFASLAAFNVGRGLVLSLNISNVDQFIMANNNFTIFSYTVFASTPVIGDVTMAIFNGLNIASPFNGVKIILIENNTIAVSAGDGNDVDGRIRAIPFDLSSNNNNNTYNNQLAPPQRGALNGGITFYERGSVQNIGAVVIHKNSIFVQGYYSVGINELVSGICMSYSNANINETRPNETDVLLFLIEDNVINVTMFGHIGSESVSAIKYRPGFPSNVTTFVVSRNNVMVQLLDFDFTNSKYFADSYLKKFFGIALTPPKSSYNAGGIDFLTISFADLDGIDLNPSRVSKDDFGPGFLRLVQPPDGKILGFQNFTLHDNEVSISGPTVHFLRFAINGQLGLPLSDSTAIVTSSSSPSSCGSSSSSLPSFYLLRNNIRLTANSWQASTISVRGPAAENDDETRTWSSLVSFTNGGRVSADYLFSSALAFLTTPTEIIMSLDAAQFTRMKQISVENNVIELITAPIDDNVEKKNTVAGFFSPLFFFQSNVSILNGLFLTNNQIDLTQTQFPTTPATTSILFSFYPSTNDNDGLQDVLGRGVGISFGGQILISGNNFTFPPMPIPSFYCSSPSFFSWKIDEDSFGESDLVPKWIQKQQEKCFFVAISIKNNKIQNVPASFFASGGLISIIDAKSSTTTRLPKITMIDVETTSITSNYDASPPSTPLTLINAPIEILGNFKAFQIKVVNTSVDFLSTQQAIESPSFEMIRVNNNNNNNIIGTGEIIFQVVNTNVSGINFGTSRLVASLNISNNNNNKILVSPRCLRVNQIQVRKSKQFLALPDPSYSLSDFSLCSGDSPSQTLTPSISVVPDCSPFTLKYSGDELKIQDVRGKILRLPFSLVLDKDDDNGATISYPPSPQRKIQLTHAPAGQEQQDRATVLKLNLDIAGDSNSSNNNKNEKNNNATISASTPDFAIPLFAQVISSRSFFITIQFSSQLSDEGSALDVKFYIPSNEIVMCKSNFHDENSKNNNNNNRRNATRNTILLPLRPYFVSLLSVSAKLSMQSAATSMAFVAAASGDPSGLAELNIVQALSAFSSCDFSDSKKQPSSMNPLLFGFGQESGYYQRGAIVANLFISFVLLLVLFCAAKYLERKRKNNRSLLEQRQKNEEDKPENIHRKQISKKYNSPPFRAYLYQLLLPGILMLTIYGLIHGTIVSSTALLRHSKLPNDYFLSFLGFASTLCFIVWVAYVVFFQIHQVEKFFWYFDRDGESRKSFLDHFMNGDSNVISSKGNQELIRRRAASDRKMKQMDMRNKSAARLFPRCAQCNIRVAEMQKEREKEERKEKQQSNNSNSLSQFFSSEIQHHFLESSQSDKIRKIRDDDVDVDDQRIRKNQSLIRPVQARKSTLLQKMHQFGTWLTTPYGEWELLRPILKSKRSTKSTQKSKTKNDSGNTKLGNLTVLQRRFPDQTHFLLDKATYRGRHLTLILILVGCSIAIVTGIAPPPSDPSSNNSSSCANLGTVASLLSMIPFLYYLAVDPFRKKTQRFIAYGTAFGIFFVGFFIILAKISRPEVVVNFVAPTTDVAQFCFKGWISCKSSINAVIFVRFLLNAEFGRTCFWVVKHYVLHGKLLAKCFGANGSTRDDEVNDNDLEEELLNVDQDGKRRNGKRDEGRNYDDDDDDELLPSWKRGDDYRGQIRNRKISSHCWGEDKC